MSPETLSLFDAGPVWGGRAFRGFAARERAVVRWRDPETTKQELLSLISRLESALQTGSSRGVLALAYEAGWLFQPHAPTGRPEPGQILADLALYDEWEEVDYPAAGDANSPARESRPVPTAASPFHVHPWQPALSRAAHAESVERIRRYIEAGDVYQLNLVNRLSANYEGDPLSLYLSALGSATSPYLCFLRRPEFDLVSLSPERFLRRSGDLLYAAPIKGTVRREAHPGVDRRLAAELELDPKNRAENVMIADLFRSDLGRVARTGSVRVEALARVRSFPTVHHLVSEITAELRPGVGLAEILEATFPSGSITGAPKLRSMELIQELEPAPRGFSMGALGLFRALDDWEMSVSIRTLEAREGVAYFPVGGAITWDSEPASEWEECETKRAALESALAAQAGLPCGS